jgi:hypothetical protein
MSAETCKSDGIVYVLKLEASGDKTVDIYDSPRLHVGLLKCSYTICVSCGSKPQEKIRQRTTQPLNVKVVVSFDASGIKNPWYSA